MTRLLNCGHTGDAGFGGNESRACFLPKII